MTNELICLEEKYSTTRMIKPGTTFSLACSKKGGLKTQGYGKVNLDQMPVISIITVVFNGEKHITQAIESVLNQTYRNVEYIIIDGGSQDGTIAILEQYQNALDLWTSEQDNGIYHAMNKGIDVASGKWIYFLGADDYLASPQVLSNMTKYLLINPAQIQYGNMRFPEDNTMGTIPKDTQEIIKYGRMIPHQATFMTKSLFEHYQGFDTSYRIAGDFHMILKAIRDKENPVYHDVDIAYMRRGGISQDDSKSLLLWQEYKRALLDVTGKISGYVRRALVKSWIKKTLFSLLGSHVSHKIIHRYRLLRKKS